VLILVVYGEMSSLLIAARHTYRTRLARRESQHRAISSAAAGLSYTVKAA
jgi:hypothetical protein